MKYKIFWTKESINNLDEILDYLNNRWTNREVINFKNKLGRQIKLIEQNPYLFPASGYNKRLRKAVLSKQTTIFYEIRNNLIYIVFVFVNYKNIDKIKD